MHNPYDIRIAPKKTRKKRRNRPGECAHPNCKNVGTRRLDADRPHLLYCDEHTPPTFKKSAPEQKPIRAYEKRCLARLGLTTAATNTEIKAVFAKLVKAHHPDAGSGDTHRVQEIIEAYKYLRSTRQL